MNNKIKWLVVVLIFAVIMFGAVYLYNNLKNGISDEQPDISVQQQDTDNKIDFTVFDKDQNEVKLSQFIGKPVVINFWATWCPYCVDEMPIFEQMYKKYGDEVEFMMINSTDGNRETKEKAMQYVLDKEYTFPVYYDLKYQANYAFYVNSLPVTFFINKYGNVVTYINGRTDAKTLEKGINLIR